MIEVLPALPCEPKPINPADRFIDLVAMKEYAALRITEMKNMSALTEARHDVADYMIGMPTGYTGTFEAVFHVMFGPLKFDAHVRAYRAHQFYAEQKIRLADADIAVRAECDRQMADGRVSSEARAQQSILQHRGGIAP